MAKKKEKYAINPMTGEKLYRTINVMVCGLSDEELIVVDECLPNKDVRIIDCTDCLTHLVALGYIAAVINPDYIDENDAEMLNVRADELKDAAEKFIFTKHNDFTKNMSKNMNAVVLNDFDELVDKLKYILLEANRRYKKNLGYSETLAQIIMVLSEIRKNPYVTTAQLAEKVECSTRTIQRYIKTLQWAGESIEYDKSKKGWYLINNMSVILGDY